MGAIKRWRLILAIFVLVALGWGSYLVKSPFFISANINQPLEFYVSPNGSPQGDGSREHPWDLQTALNQPAAVQPGSIIWLLGGTYKGQFESHLKGTESAPIRVRALPGERVVLDGYTGQTSGNFGSTLSIANDSKYSWYEGFEVTTSNPKRVTKDTGYNPTDMAIGGGVNVYGPQNKLINLIIYDNTSSGIGFWTAPEPGGGEAYGNIIFNNGWQAPDRWHGHSIYAQNLYGTKLFKDNLIINPLSYGIHFYAEGGSLVGSVWQRNVAFGGSHTWGGSAGVENLRIEDNFFYGGVFYLGYSNAINEDIVFKGNYVMATLIPQYLKNATFTDNVFGGLLPLTNLFSIQPYSAPSDFRFEGNQYYNKSQSMALGRVWLSWQLGSDNLGLIRQRVERCTGADCTDFSPIVGGSKLSNSATSILDQGLSPGATYRYRVRTDDAAYNVSYSPVITVTIPAATSASSDQTPPLPPRYLSAKANPPSSITLSWFPGLDNIALSEYQIERCAGENCSNFEKIASLSFQKTSYTDTNLSPDTLYRYRLRSKDLLGNLSDYSEIVSATTLTGTDATPPSAPTELYASANASSLLLVWHPSSDNVGVVEYQIERCEGENCQDFTQIGTSATNTFVVPTGAHSSETGTTQRYRVRAKDAAGNLSPYSSVEYLLAVTAAQNGDTTPPAAASNLTAYAGSLMSLCSTLYFNGSVSGYQNCPAGAHRWQEDFGYDLSGEYLSGPSGIWVFVIPNDYDPNQANVVIYNWDKAAEVEIPESEIQKVLKPGDSYRLHNVQDYFNDIDRGDYSGGALKVRMTNRSRAVPFGLDPATWNKPSTFPEFGVFRLYRTPDSTPPTTPSNFKAESFSSNAIKLTWQASTDNGVLAGYQIERCQGVDCTDFQTIFSTPSYYYYFIDTNLSPNTVYRYQIKAKDQVNNLSSPSSIVSASTLSASGGPTTLTTLPRLVKGSSPAVYLIDQGKKYLIPNPSLFNQWGFKWSEIRLVSDSLLASIPSAPTLTRLAKGSSPAVYLIDQGKKYLIPNPFTFNHWGFYWSDIRTLSDSFLSSIPSAPTITRLAKGSSKAVYFLENGKKRLIPNPSTFRRLGFQWSSVRTLSDSLISSIPTGSVKRR